MTLWTEEEYNSRMLKGWVHGRANGTVCGSGSTLDATKTIREQLPAFLAKHNIKRVCDAGAGDLYWVKHVIWDIDFQGFDLFPRDPAVKQLDITRAALPTCDAILCRLVLGHMDIPRIEKALALFKQSAKYLLATRHDDYNNSSNTAFNHFDLSHAPFNLGPPIDELQDCRDYKLSLWSLQ